MFKGLIFCILLWQKNIAVCSPRNVALLLLVTSVAVYLCSLQFLALDRWLNISNSQVFYEVLNPVYKCTSRPPCTGDTDLYLATLYTVSSPDIIRVIKSRIMRWVGHVARTGERRGACRVLAGKPHGNRQLGRPRRRWDDNTNPLKHSGSRTYHQV